MTQDEYNEQFMKFIEGIQANAQKAHENNEKLFELLILLEKRVDQLLERIRLLELTSL